MTTMDVDYSAHAVLTRALDIMDDHNIFPLHAVLDVGCGDGQWLAAAHDLLGDEGPLVGVDLARRDGLTTPPQAPGYSHFIPDDLNRLEDPAQIDDVIRTALLPDSRGYDLVVCVEVAEHLRPAASHGLIAMLTTLSRTGVILWSAAPPGQGPYDPDDPENPGTHRNERWPWEWEALFAAQGFAVCDGLRPVLWEDDRIDWWYRQNVLLYVSKTCPIPPRRDELTLISSTILRELASAHPQARPLAEEEEAPW